MNNKPKLPNFLIVGAGKSGTTSMFAYIERHPDVFMPKGVFKETRFFINNLEFTYANRQDEIWYERYRIYTLEEYAALFENHVNEKAIGEASTPYLYFYETAIPKIKQYLGDPKIIIFLRDPVDRAFSSYLHIVRDGFEKLPFDKSLELEEQRKQERMHMLFNFKDPGLYYNQVKAYLDNFSQVKIWLFDDLSNNTLDVVQQVCQFLEVDDSYTHPVINRKFNTAALPASNPINRFLVNRKHPYKKYLRPLLFNTIGRRNTLKILNYVKNKRLPKMKPETRRELKAFFREDILKLQDLIGRDLSMWLE